MGGGYLSNLFPNKTKGFTLIELLAVIVVLAIIALIAVPIVLNIIEKSREGAAVSSARNYIKAVETYVVTSELDKNKLKLDKSNKYNVTKDTIIESKNYIKTNELVSLKGSFPTGLDDYIVVGDTKQVTEARLTISGYEILIENDKVVSVVKGKKIAVESIGLNKTKETMERGSTFTLEAIFNPENASDQRVKYTSDNEEIVTVTEEGVVTAKNIGTAKVIVTSIDNTSKKAECEIEVIASATGLKIEPTESEIVVGEKVTLIGLIEPSDSTTSSLTWTTSDINIASIDENGVVTGISEGEAIITATTVNGIEATANITVYKTELLITKVKVGDYVAYDAGVWTETKARPTSQGEFGGYTKGENKANSSYFGDNVLTNLKGWRVLKIEGNIVTIIHAGVPEYYYHAYGYTSESLAILNSRAISEYLNPIYATSAHILTYEEAIAITGSGEATTNSLRYLSSSVTSDTGVFYWLATTLTPGCLEVLVGNGAVGGVEADRDFTIRPVIELKEGIKTRGKIIDAVGQVAWSLIAP